ncbi:MAG: glycosyltransferase family protein [Pseudomonadota bacterium]
MKSLVIIQARMSSTRFPGKVLKEIAGKPMLWWQVSRIKTCKKVDHIVVATSTDASDDVIYDWCVQQKIDVRRGSLHDVLDRYYQVAKEFKPLTIIRLTADCPFSDPTIIDDMIDLHDSSKADYTSNIFPPTFVHGLDAEIVSFNALEAAWRESTEAEDREHVLPFVYKNKKRFHASNFQQAINQSKIRLTVDYPEDFDLIKKVMLCLNPKTPLFSIDDICRILDKNPDMAQINAHRKSR